MDHQTSKSRCKTIRFLLQRNCIAIGIILLFPFGCASAYTTTNPLSVEVSVSALVPLSATNNPDQYPSTPPSLPAVVGPVNMVDTLDVAVFRGLAYPGSVISLIKNGVLVTEGPANLDGNFEIRLRNLTPGTYTFGLRAEDANQTKSKLLTFTVYVSQGIITLVEGIFIPPTITTDKIDVKQEGVIKFSGMSAPNAAIKLSINKKQEVIKNTNADYKGLWSYSLSASELGYGSYEAKAMSLTLTNTSPYGDTVAFTVGDVDRLRNNTASLLGFRKRCDLNNDSRVNILDFSIMAFWYKRLGFPDKVDLSSDGRVNLTDLSILAYCWTG